jgi:tRNA pseudouridine65 synthase
MEPHDLSETDDFIDETLNRPLKIVYQDENYVAVFKPAGLVVHRGKRSHPSDPVLLQSLRDQLNRRVYPVHRLDRPTAGLILFGLSGDAAAKMVAQFTNRLVTKHYQALVRGLAPIAGTIDSPLLAEHSHESVRVGDEQNPTREALTHFALLAQFQTPWKTAGWEEAAFSLLEIRPTTGRWHQIRQHLGQISLPVLGDYRHGDPLCNQLLFEKTGVYRMLLTAIRLDFRNPYHGELQTLIVNRGSEFDRALQQLEPYKIHAAPSRDERV